MELAKLSTSSMCTCYGMAYMKQLAPRFCRLLSPRARIASFEDMVGLYVVCYHPCSWSDRQWEDTVTATRAGSEGASTLAMFGIPIATARQATVKEAAMQNKLQGTPWWAGKQRLECCLPSHSASLYVYQLHAVVVQFSICRPAALPPASGT